MAFATRESLLILTFVLLAGCAGNEYRFERIDGPQVITLPFKLDGIRGVRDGATVNAEARFSAGSDFLTMKITLYLVPPPEFRSGTYEGNVGGKPVAGETDASSVMYFGGQADQPSLGGVFIFKDEQNRPLYRVRIPATPMSRR